VRVTSAAAFAAYQILKEYLTSGGQMPGVDDDDVAEFMEALLKSKTIDIGEEDADLTTDS
jgi:hypothetical protein